jgi:nucleoside 2-deoxyribosyltransferase
MALENIYLAGSWVEWRSMVMSRIKGCNWFDPNIAHDKTLGIDLSNWFEIETEMLKSSDALICYISKDDPSGYGSTFEMGMMYAQDKPYILIIEKENKYQWGMQSKGADYCCDTFEKAFEWIKENNWMNLSVI